MGALRRLTGAIGSSVMPARDRLKPRISTISADRLSLETIRHLQAGCFAGGAGWRGWQLMRVSVISWLIEDASGEAAADAILAAWRAVRS